MKTQAILVSAIIAGILAIAIVATSSSAATAADKQVSIVFTKSERAWPEGDYINLSTELLANDTVVLNGIQIAKQKFDESRIFCNENKFACTSTSPLGLDYSFTTKINEQQAKLLISKLGFRDISPPDNPPFRHYGLHIYYNGDYYGIAILGVPTQNPAL